MNSQHHLIIKEACVESFQEALLAQKLGANRIELCFDLTNSGTTPSYGTVLQCKTKLNIPINCIIRPRKGNFIYDQNDIEIMLNDLTILISKCHIDGIVIGALTGDNTIDLTLMKRLIDKAKELDKNISITFHMAFDEIEDQAKAIEDIITLGCHRLLTKGGKFKNAIEGKDAINKLCSYSKGRIIIMPGGGITNKNYMEIIDYCKECWEVHGTKVVGVLR